MRQNEDVREKKYHRKKKFNLSSDGSCVKNCPSSNSKTIIDFPGEPRSIYCQQVFPVTLRVYDLTDGKACRWSKLVLGVWHTGLLVYGYEYFYGDGIVRMRPTSVEPILEMKLSKEVFMGYTTVLRSEFEEYLVSIGDAFTPVTYDLLSWNCNHFTNICLWRLLEKDLPYYILGQNKDIANAPNGRFILFISKLLNLNSSRSSSLFRGA